MSSPLPTSSDPYRLIRGFNLRKEDIKEWSSKQFMEFFRFMDFLADIPGKTTTVTMPQDKLIAIEKIEEFKELLIRFNVPLHDFPQWRLEKELTKRLTPAYMLVARFLKTYPSFIDNEMKQWIEEHPKLHAIKKHFKLEETKAGIPMILPDTTLLEAQTVGKTYMPEVKLKDSEISLMESMIKVAQVFDMVVSSINVKEIKSMDIQKKIGALQKLAFVFTQSRNMKPNSTVFKQLNINTTSTKDLEKAVLQFAEEGDNNE